MDLSCCKKLYYLAPNPESQQTLLTYFDLIANNAKECDQVLFESNTATELTLLHISLIRKHLGLGAINSCDENLQSKILDYLIHCLKLDSQFINFTASKALVSLLKCLSSKMNGKYLSIIISTFISCKDNTHVAIYALQTVSELLKTFRKDISTTKTSRATADSCLMIVSSNWENITASLCVEHSSLSHLVIEQGLSLCLECLRFQMDEVVMDKFVHSFPLLLRVVVDSSSLLCEIKLMSVMRKIISKLSGPFISDLFQTLKYHATSIVGKWFLLKSVSVYNSMVIECNLDSQISTVACESPVVSRLEQIFLRKYFLLSLQLASFTTMDSVSASYLLCNPLCDFLLYLQTLSLQNFQIPEKLMMLFLRKVVLQLVTEEDGCLVATLNSFLKISEQAGVAGSLPLLVVQSCDIHHFFFLFLKSVGFDVSTVLDLVISNETTFDVFFLSYLRLISTDSGGNNLTLVCQSLVNETAAGACESEECSKGKTKASKGRDISVVENEALEKLLNCFSSMYTKLDNVMEKELVMKEKLSIISEILEQIEAMGS